MATKKIKIRLQGHEKFALREGWINKGLMILAHNSDAFTRKDATDLFGISISASRNEVRFAICGRL